MSALKKILLIASAALLGLGLGGSIHCQTVTMDGEFVQPDGTPINGSFSIGLRGSTFKNICSSPFQVVPSTTKTYKIVNGVIQGISGASFVSQDCLTPRYPYYVQVADTSGAVLMQDNWYLPRVLGSVIHIGEMGGELLGTVPISVSLPIGIISTPSGSQTITQPSGTSLIINGATVFNGAVTFSTFPTISTLIATKGLFGGLTTSTYPLDVLGVIDSTQGYAVNGSGGTVGQCIVSNGTAGVWGTCAAPFPALYNQSYTLTSSTATSSVSPRGITNIVSSAVSSTDNATANTSNIILNDTSAGAEPYFVTANSLFGTSTGCAYGDGQGGIALTTNGCLSATISSDFVGIRTFNTNYQNNTTHAIMVSITCASNGASAGTCSLYVGPNNITLYERSAGSAVIAGSVQVSFIVPAGWWYSLTTDDLLGSHWYEIALQ